MKNFLALVLPVMFLFTSCTHNSQESESTLFSEVKAGNQKKDTIDLTEYYASEEEEVIDLEQIKKRGKLVALTGYSHAGYFIYKGTPMGFEYDLLNYLATHLGVSLEIIVVKDYEKMFEMLKNGEGDIIAHNLAMTKNRTDVSFTIHHNTSRQVLVQRKPDNWRKLKKHNLEKLLIRDPLFLLGKEVHVLNNSAYHTRLKNLCEEVGGDIKIKGVNTDVEDLILQVAEGKISYTIADEDIANLNQSYLPILDVSTPVSFQQRISWVVRKESPELLHAVNDWIKKIKKKPKYNITYNKYFRERRGIDERIKCNRLMNCGKRISPYDSLIIKHAAEIGWDWRLLASLVYQESRFDPKAQSWAGASGLMQLMPATAAEFGAKDPFNPEEAIAAGARYLKWLDKYWKRKVEDPEERLKFILASYNVGQEHVADAARLANKYKRKPNVWDDNVAYYVLMKSKPKYSNDPVVRYGYCRGEEPFNYVNSILERYEHYKNLIDESV